MFLLAPLAIAAAPGIIAGISSFFGQKSANKANRVEAQKNRDFQERMRNTEWQAGVADMQAAGINPAVAYSRGGASAPSGSVAAPAGNALGEGVSSALAANAQRKSIELLNAQIESTDAVTIKTQAEGQQAAIKAKFDVARMGMYFDPDGKPTQAMRDILNSEFATTQANSAKSVSDAQMSAFSVPEQQAIAKLWDQLGADAKGLQILLPLLTTMMGNRGGRR